MISAEQRATAADLVDAIRDLSATCGEPVGEKAGPVQVGRFQFEATVAGAISRAELQAAHRVIAEAAGCLAEIVGEPEGPYGDEVGS